MQARGGALGEQRLLGHVPRLRDQRREQAHVLLEEVEHRGDPAFAEPHPRAHALGGELGRAGVQRLHERGDAGLVPQPLAQQERRVRGEGHLRAGDRLRGVPCGGELLGRDLEVQLHRRAGGFRGDRVEGGIQPTALAIDAQVDLLAAGHHHGVLERLVARARCPPLVVREQLLGDGGEMADRDHAGAVTLRGGIGALHLLAQLGLQIAQPGAGGMGHRKVRLEVEPADLVDEVLVVQILQDRVHQQGGRHPVGLGEVHLQLDADGSFVDEFRRVQEGLEQVEVPTQLLAIAGALGTGVLRGADLASHGDLRVVTGQVRQYKHAAGPAGYHEPWRGTTGRDADPSASRDQAVNSATARIAVSTRP